MRLSFLQGVRAFTLVGPRANPSTDVLALAEASFGSEGRGVVAALAVEAAGIGAKVTTTQVNGRRTFLVDAGRGALSSADLEALVSRASAASTAWCPVLIGTRPDGRFIVELHPTANSDDHGSTLRSHLWSCSQLTLHRPSAGRPQRAPVDVREVWEKSQGSLVYPDPGVLSHKSLDEIAQGLGVTPERLEGHLRESVVAWVDELKTAVSYGGSEAFPLIDALYNLHQLSAAPPAPWIASLRTFEAFVEHFCPTATAHAKAHVVHNVEVFIAQQIRPARFRGGDWWDGHIAPTYLGAGNWVAIP
ncbi:MAG TPA: hypothetical protein VFH51_10670, partial [Myxococcota bacterium]|nr:hypothetical protein [Myxococcota bacterium]